MGVLARLATLTRLALSNENSLREPNHFHDDSRFVVKQIYHINIFSELSIKPR